MFFEVRAVPAPSQSRPAAVPSKSCVSSSSLEHRTAPADFFSPPAGRELKRTSVTNQCLPGFLRFSKRNKWWLLRFEKWVWTSVCNGCYAVTLWNSGRHWRAQNTKLLINRRWRSHGEELELSRPTFLPPDTWNWVVTAVTPWQVRIFRGFWFWEVVTGPWRSWRARSTNLLT